MANNRMIVVQDKSGKDGMCFAEKDYIGISSDPWHHARMDALAFMFGHYGGKEKRCAYNISAVNNVIFYKVA